MDIDRAVSESPREPDAGSIESEATVDDSDMSPPDRENVFVFETQLTLCTLAALAYDCILPPYTMPDLPDLPQASNPRRPSSGSVATDADVTPSPKNRRSTASSASTASSVTHSSARAGRLSNSTMNLSPAQRLNRMFRAASEANDAGASVSRGYAAPSRFFTKPEWCVVLCQRCDASTAVDTYLTCCGVYGL